MRRYLLAIFACLSVFMIAATPAFTIVPTVIVYPMQTSTSMDREDNARIVTTLANQLAVGAAIKVIPANTDVDRANYLADARAHGANYYVTGSMTPLGSGASLVAQVVSTTSGTLIFSTTSYITSLAEVAVQGDQLRAGIIDRSTRGIQAFQAPPPPVNTPAPSATGGAELNANKLFGKKKAAVSRVPAGDATIAVLTVGGSADNVQRAAAAKSLVDAIVRTGRHAIVVDAPAPSNAVCTTSHASGVVAAWLDTPPPNATQTNSSLRLIGYDCSGNVAFDRTFKQALSGITDAAVDAYLNAKGRA